MNYIIFMDGFMMMKKDMKITFNLLKNLLIQLIMEINKNVILFIIL